MKKSLAMLGAAALAAPAVVFTASTASAQTSYDPNVTRVPNPAQVCKSIPGSVLNASAIFGIPVDVSSFDFSDCVKTVARGDALLPYGSPYEQCAMLVAMGVITYPMVLHAGEAGPEDDLLPDFLVRNQRECGNALFAYHTIVSFFPEEP